jgi:hypothetical protein
MRHTQQWRGGLILGGLRMKTEPIAYRCILGTKKIVR